MLKKMKVGTRVLFGFLIAIILTIILGAVSIIGSNMMSGKINGLYDGPYAAQQEIATIKVDINQATQDIYGAMMTSDQAQLCLVYTSDHTIWHDMEKISICAKTEDGKADM